ncbi:Holliday junction resolvase RuvX [Siphonobacter sp.]|uniref:Holliday junction resolvase RuvX n=1 Tax=Siphonobacter sp. TaxID=1869184 RepID=UPI003B3AB55F
MARILAIDYGTKRVGLAVTDPLQLIATALETVHSKDVMNFLKAYCQRESVEAFVVGMPTNLDGTDTSNTPHVRGFIRLLRKSFPETPVHEHDERFTSVMALQALISMGTTKKDRRDKGVVDRVSATIILQSFLETRRI